MALFLCVFALKVFGGVIVALVGLYLYFKLVLYSYWKKNGVVYVEPTIPTGNLINVVRGKTHMVDCFADAYKKLKKNRYFGMYTFHKPSLVIADPDLIRMVMTKEFLHFHDRGIYCNEEVDPLSGHIFLLPGQKWRNLRVKLTPTFTSGKMKLMFHVLKDKADVLVETLESKARNRELVEIKDIIARYATDVIFSTAFGVNCDSLRDPDSEFRYWGRKVFELGAVKNAFTFFAPKVMDFFEIPILQNGTTNFFMRIFEETVNYRIANNVRRKDFLDLLMQLMKSGHVEDEDEKEAANISESIDGKLNMKEAAAQAFVFYAAGFETSSTTVSHCLYELSVNPEIQEKVRQEIEITLKKHGDVTYESLNDMIYLQKCLSEALRKYPPLGTLHRVCTKDIDLPTTNLRVRKGIDIVIPTLAIHMDPEIYTDPIKFDPERFDEQNIAARHPYTYLPFGEGPRICIGMRFGYAQTKIALISLLRRFRFSLGPFTSVPLEIDPALSFIYTAKEIHLYIEPIA